MTTYLPGLRELSPGLDREWLHSHLLKALRLARANIELLDRSSSTWSTGLDAYVDVADKAIIETALLVLVASRIPKLPIETDRLLRDLASMLSPLIRTERNRSLLMRYPHTAAALGIGHIALVRLGDNDEEFDNLVRQALASGHVEATERLPYRTMDVMWLRGLIEDVRPRFDSAMPHSILRSAAHPIHMSAPDTYALTHAIMYLTDFGADPPPIADVAGLGATVDSALACHAISDNFDLLGELLMSASMLGVPWSPYAQLGFRIFADAWERFGFLPSPTFDASDYAGLTAAEATQYVFRHLYHTNYVGGMLCALLLRDLPHGNNAVAWSVPRPSCRDLLGRCEQAILRAAEFCKEELSFAAPPGLGEAMATTVPDEPNPHRSGGDADTVDWAREPGLDTLVSCLRNYSDSLGSSAACWKRSLTDTGLRDADLMLVLSDALLIRAAQDYRLQELTQVLSLVAGSEMPISSTCCAAVDFLIRQQLPCGAISTHLVNPGNRETPEAIAITAGIGRHLARISQRLEAMECGQKMGTEVGGGSYVNLTPCPSSMDPEGAL